MGNLLTGQLEVKFPKCYAKHKSKFYLNYYRPNMNKDGGFKVVQKTSVNNMTSMSYRSGYTKLIGTLTPHKISFAVML